MDKKMFESEPKMEAFNLTSFSTKEGLETATKRGLCNPRPEGAKVPASKMIFN